MDAVRAGLLETHTCIPVQVMAVVSPSNVTVQPLLMRRFKASPTVPTSVALPLPIIQNVGVLQPRGATYSIKMPIAVGDLGIALFCERSLDKYMAGAGVLTDPADTRMHHLSDPIFVPGLYPFKLPLSAGSGSSATTDLVLTNGLLEMSLQKAGTLLVKNEAVELMDLLNQLITLVINMNTQLVAATTNTILGPMPLNNAALFAEYLAETTALQVQFDTLKGS